ncbi:myosin light chain kinase family member 4 isoform X2 [Triplophysa rosa]|uniref:myosin light chain kinase family member 4 isoform X2 n=1 Tax=Triplophysa rosa TaxID=992332 RepID=UPI0025462002|nr:myosin light chain kinase family member 4 isoform X2 [Triplophysa rosa]
MENFLQDKDLWIVGSVCLVASILWRPFWNLFTHKRRREVSPESPCFDIQLKDKDGKEKSKVYPKGLKTQKKNKLQDASDLVQADLEEVQKLNEQNIQFSQCTTTATSSTSASLSLFEKEQETEQCREEKDDTQSVAVEEEPRKEKIVAELLQVKDDEPPEEKTQDLAEILQKSQNSFSQNDDRITVTQDSCVEHQEIPLSPKRHVSDENLESDELKKSRVEEASEELQILKALETEGEAAEVGPERTEEATAAERQDGEPVTQEYVIDTSSPPPAPFEHRLVTTKTHQITSYYTINKEEVLGGGRFGVVHKCVEKSSGLILAAKIIKARSQKEKEVVKSEIEVMNQLNHSNLIQLYAAFESRHEIVLVMEYVDGGELFDRIIDENYKLTELDTVLFIRQITEGLQYMHKMYILHLDLKPENILCISRQTNKVKIIDFGLARRYKPREKLRVNFGTPEFLAPEVINYEFVSFPTDMWSLGVITYMLLSGLSPFLGEDDNETLNSILACQWSFEEAEFADISEEAKDFISRLLLKSKSWRMSASQSLKHPWLSDRELHYRLHKKKNKCHSSHAPPLED